MLVDDAQIIYMPFVVLDQTDDLFFDISLGGEADFPDKVAAVELYHLKSLLFRLWEVWNSAIAHQNQRRSVW